MNTQIERILVGQTDNHLLPFLWMMGEDWDKTKRQIHRIYDCGIRAMCLESRTFQDFCGETWWETLKKVLEEARTLGMKVWILDDKHYPTGMANGKVAEKYPDRRRLHLAEHHTDVMGPRSCDVLIEGFEAEDQFVAAYAIRRPGYGEELDVSQCIPLERDESGHFVSFDAPEGCWRVFSLWLTYAGQWMKTPYISMLETAGADALIEEVYEAHYRHVGEYFGKELVGFFSDEPNIGNDFVYGHTPGGFYDKNPGQPGLAMPWCGDMLEQLNARLGRDITPLLPLLWFEGEGSAEVRETYMDVVSRLYGERFTQRIGDWCRAHNVEYIGHIIEDQNAHARLGCSAGHYFRSLEGQDMAGIDIVLHQVMPGFAEHISAAVCAGYRADPAFFQYVLCKLAPSLAHIRPHMKNRAMCEVFGAYGWAEDAAMMKWLIDHLLVRGVNYFVPHAFSPLYPNPDCPPHFDADGYNPQYEDFAHLMRYTNTMATLFNGNRVARVALLYHAEGEWSGKACMLNDYPAVELLNHQIDFDIIPADELKHPVFRDGHWVIGNGAYDALVVPYAEYLPAYVTDGFKTLCDHGITVLGVGSPMEQHGLECVPLEALSDELTARKLTDVLPKTSCPLLRYMHQVREDGSHAFMFFNEATDARAVTTLKLPVSGGYTQLDWMGGHTRRGYSADGCVDISLSPYESTVLVFDGETACADAETVLTAEELDARWRIELADCENLAHYELFKEDSALCTVEKARWDFAGRIRYTAHVSDMSTAAAIELENVGDSAQVLVNGHDVGRRICAPFRFDMDGLGQSGDNTIEIIVSTTLARRVRDRFSTFVAMNKPGLTGKVTIWKK